MSTYHQMMKALEEMDEGVHPVEYLYQKFYPHPRLRGKYLFQLIDFVVEYFYANYF